MEFKSILFVFFISLFLLTFVTADILSINSGGGNGFIINPGAYLESFFFQSNHLPILSNLILTSSSGTNTTNENLSVSYISTDADGDKITNISDWRLNGNSIAILNMPFDTRRLNGNVRDYSIFQNNGTLGGGVITSVPTWKPSCQVGGCYEFGNSANREYLQIPSITDVHYNLTLSSWIYPTNYPAEKSTIILGQGAYYLSLANDSSVQTYWYGRDPAGYHSSGLNTIPLNTWSYVVAVWSQSQVKIYVNGILKNTIVVSNESGNSSSGVIIGAENLSRQFKGSIDEVQIYDKSLTSEQINILYQAGLNHHQLEKMSSQETSKGDVWQVAMTPNDAFVIN